MGRAFLAFSVGLAILAGARAALSADQPAAEKSRALEVGQPFPELACTNDTGRPWRAADYVGCKILVIYFSTGDFTDGSIEQAKGFREVLKRLEELNVFVVGISGDTVGTHELFKKAHGLRYTLLADPEGTAAERLGIPFERWAHATKIRTRGLDGKPIMDDHGKSIIVQRKVTFSRWTLIVSLDGKLLSKRPDVDPPNDADEVRKVVEGLSPTPTPCGS